MERLHKSDLSMASGVNRVESGLCVPQIVVLPSCRESGLNDLLCRLNGLEVCRPMRDANEKKVAKRRTRGKFAEMPEERGE